MPPTIYPDNWVSTLRSVERRGTFLLAPGRYIGRDIYLSGPTAINLISEVPGQAILDANFTAEGIARFSFTDCAFEWTPVSGEKSKFNLEHTGLWFQSCSGVSYAKGGLINGRAMSAVHFISGSSADSVWDFSNADILNSPFIENEGACYTQFTGAPGRAGRNRVIFRVPNMNEVAINLFSGKAYLVNFLIEGPPGGGNQVGLRIDRGTEADILVFPTDRECGIANFRRGLTVAGISSVGLNAEESMSGFAFRDCGTGVLVEDADLRLNSAQVKYVRTLIPIVASPLARVMAWPPGVAVAPGAPDFSGGAPSS